MSDTIYVTLDEFLDGVARCKAIHFKTIDSFTAKGNPRSKILQIKLFDGNVRYTPPHIKIDSVTLSFTSPEDTMNFVNSLRLDNPGRETHT